LEKKPSSSICANPKKAFVQAAEDDYEFEASPMSVIRAESGTLASSLEGEEGSDRVVPSSLPPLQIAPFLGRGGHRARWVDTACFPRLSLESGGRGSKLFASWVCRDAARFTSESGGCIKLCMNAQHTERIFEKY
jgi:hypothetical protein